MLSDRRRSVLAALVQEYVRSAQPVASRHLVERYDLRVSPATVRNELSVLEESGYVFQPHVSAGRVPTDSGYRAFVDAMMEADPGGGLTPDEVESVHGQFIALEHELAEAMRETSTLLSRLTSYVAIVIAPALRRARIRRINLVWIAETRAVVVVVTDSGRVADRNVELPEIVTSDQLAGVERLLNSSLEGKIGDDVRGVRGGVEAVAGVSPRVAVTLIDEVLDCLLETDGDRVVTGGMPALLAQPEFADPRLVGPLIQLLEDGLATLQVLTQVMNPGDVAIRIGSENPVGLDRLSVVTAHYDAGGAGGLVGVIGPTRMNYPRAVSAVRAAADGLTEALG
ncbi:MAG TPA: heat-inducible transcriptional repressor HrcA [Coriobacteriia bacterium]